MKISSHQATGTITCLLWLASKYLILIKNRIYSLVILMSHCPVFIEYDFDQFFIYFLMALEPMLHILGKSSHGPFSNIFSSTFLVSVSSWHILPLHFSFSAGFIRTPEVEGIESNSIWTLALKARVYERQLDSSPSDLQSPEGWLSHRSHDKKLSGGLGHSVSKITKISLPTLNPFPCHCSGYKR